MGRGGVGSGGVGGRGGWGRGTLKILKSGKIKDKCSCAMSRPMTCTFMGVRGGWCTMKVERGKRRKEERGRMARKACPASTRYASRQL